MSPVKTLEREMVEEMEISYRISVEEAKELIANGDDEIPDYNADRLTVVRI